jgi:hypothetical protein
MLDDVAGKVNGATRSPEEERRRPAPGLLRRAIAPIDRTKDTRGRRRPTVRAALPDAARDYAPAFAS